MQFKACPKTGGGEGNMFLKLEDGEQVYVILRGEPYEFYTKWEGDKSLLTEESDPDGRFRFRINAIVKDGSKYVAKILEQGPTVYNLLKELSEEGYELETTVLKIKREGVKLNTKYIITTTPKKIDEKTQLEIDNIDLLYLGHDVESKSDSDKETPF